jgi:hypothetical protein
MLPSDGGGTMVMHPADYPYIEKYWPPEFDIDTRKRHPQFKGTLRVGVYNPSSALCTSTQCPRGHVYVTPSTGRNLTPSLGPMSDWAWPNLDQIASQWPNIDPELAKQLYPHPPKAKPLNDAQRGLLVRAIGRPALVHWKSTALRSVIELGYAKALPEMGQGYYRTTDMGRKALKIWRSAWDRIVDDAP